MSNQPHDPYAEPWQQQYGEQDPAPGQDAFGADPAAFPPAPGQSDPTGAVWSTGETGAADDYRSPDTQRGTILPDRSDGGGHAPSPGSYGGDYGAYTPGRSDAGYSDYSSAPQHTGAYPGAPAQGGSGHYPQPSGQSYAAAHVDAAETAYLPPVTDDGGPAPGSTRAERREAARRSQQQAPAMSAAEETAYLPPVTDHGGPSFPGAAGTGAGHGHDPAETAYLPPVTDHGDPSQAGGTPWPQGWERPAGQHAQPDGAAADHAGQPGLADPADPAGQPGSLRPDGPPTLYGAPAKRRPKPSAQVLREEGKSPIIEPGPQPAAITAALALLFLVTSALDVRAGLAVGVAALQVVTVAGWFRLNGMWPARQGIALAAVGGLIATGVTLFRDRVDAPAVALGTLGVWCLVIMLVQLRDTTASDERLSALTATLTAALLGVLAAGYLAADPEAVVVGVAAVAVAVLVRAIPLPPGTAPVAAALAATAAGCVAGVFTDVGPASGALLGLAAGGSALAAVRVASFDYPSRFVHMTAGIALPLSLAAPAVYLIGQALA